MKQTLGPKDIRIIQDADSAIKVMYNVGKWLADSGRDTHDYWSPEKMNLAYLSQYVNPSEFYVAIVNDVPVASVILQENERNQSWESVDGSEPLSALYIHWLAVHRDFAGIGLSKIMMGFAIKEAKRRGYTRVRLDVPISEPKLRKIYDSLGFKVVHIEEESGTVFYQMNI